MSDRGFPRHWSAKHDGERPDIEIDLTHSEETKRKMSEAKSGENNPMYGKTYSHTEDAKQKIADGNSGEEHHFFGKQLSQNHREKLSDALTGKNYGRGPPKITNSGQYRSSWEEKIAELIPDAEYEAFSLETNVGCYTPDFFIDNNIIEVKGPVFRPHEICRKLMWVIDNTDYTLIVIGTYLPSDEHLDYSNCEKLPHMIF